MTRAILNHKRLIAAPRVDVGSLVKAANVVSRDAIRASIPSFPDYLNGRLVGAQDPIEIGDCTCAAFADNLVLSSAIANNGVPAVPWPAQDEVLNLYAEVAGLPDGTSVAALAEVPGLDPVDVLQHVMTDGFVVNGETVFPTAGALPPQDQDSVEKALALTCLYSAVTLHEGDEEELQGSSGYLTTDYTPGAVTGGHMITPFSIESNGDVWIATYGGWIRATIGWLMARGAAHFVIGWEPPVTPTTQDFGTPDEEGWDGV